MQSLLPTVESILGTMARHSATTADPDIMFNACAAIIAFWGHAAINEHRLAGWVMHQFERMPVIPNAYLVDGRQAVDCDLKIRRSDEDPRQIFLRCALINPEPSAGRTNS
jgi:hypothetical protein